MSDNSDYVPKSKIAYKHIKKGILYGHYGVGGKIGISRIAGELNVSGIPVREALKQLESEGFVENIPHSGFEVTKPDFEGFVELYEIRELLAAEAVFRAAKIITDETLKILEEAVLNIWEAIHRRDFITTNKLNYSFHDAIYKECKNQYFSRFISNINSMSRARSIYTLHPSVENAKLANEEHEKILEALRNRDPERAKKEYLDHKKRSFNILLKYTSNLNFNNNGGY